MLLVDDCYNGEGQRVNSTGHFTEPYRQAATAIALAMAESERRRMQLWWEFDFHTVYTVRIKLLPESGECKISRWLNGQDEQTAVSTVVCYLDVAQELYKFLHPEHTQPERNFWTERKKRWLVKIPLWSLGGFVLLVALLLSV